MYGRYFVLFAILFTGWFLRKINFIDDKMDHSINKLVVYFAYPCLIVHNIGELDLTADVLADFGLTFVLSLVFFYLYGFFCKGYARLRKYPKNVSGIAEFAMSMPNNGFMGFPVALIFFGDSGLLLMLAHNAAMNFFIFTYGVKLLLLPLLTLAAVAFLPIDPLIRSILVLGISFPTAATVPMLAEQEGLDAGVASKILFLSTVASIGTVPLLIHIIQLVIM